MTRVAEFAPAKINLCLHVTGQRSDGYHLLETMVAFADFGDRISVEPASLDRFIMTGAFAGNLQTAPDNSVIRARDALRALFPAHTAPVSIRLEKNLPIASGIGGGSADAAACLRALSRLWALPDSTDLSGIALELGADVPMCLASRPLVARGIGERISFLDAMAPISIVLANPLVEVSTRDIFSRLATKTNPELPAIPAIDKFEQLVEFLDGLRNDLEAPAIANAPEIAVAKRAIEETGARLTRMSGTGATCFGLYESPDEARSAAMDLKQRYPQWYVVAGQCPGALKTTGIACHEQDR